MQWLGTVLSPSVDLILLCCQHEREKIIYTDFLKGMWALTIKMSLGMLRIMRARLNFYSGINLYAEYFSLKLNINLLKPKNSEITLGYAFLQQQLHSSFQYIVKV